jgi:hypothetical protein
MSGVAERVSPVERALVDLLAGRPAPFRRLPVSLLSREQKAAELVRVQQLRARMAAYEAELVLGLADDTPDDGDPPPGSPGARRGSWHPIPSCRGCRSSSSRTGMVLNCGRLAASNLAHRAWILRESLPGTWAALAAGELDEYRARVLTEALAHTDPTLARRVEARLLPDAARLTAGNSRSGRCVVARSSTRMPPAAGTSRRSGAPTSGCTPARRRAWPPWWPTCPPTPRRPATRWSTSWRRC